MAFFNTFGTVTDINILNPEHEEFDESKCLDRFKISGVEYVRSSSLATGKEARTKKSSVWRYGEKLLRLKDKREVYYCYQCERQKKKQLLPKLSGNTGAHQHLLRHHDIDSDGHLKCHPPSGQRAIDENAFTLVSVAKKSEFQRLLVRWLVYCHICLSMVENEYFRELVAYLNKGLASLLPLAKATIRRWIISAYQEEKEKIREEMKTSISSIHISFDMWTSPNYLAMLSIFAHYLDKDGIRQNRLIGFKRVLGAHTGENQAAVIIATLHEYGIASKTRYFMSDNASSNDSCVDHVLKAISPELPADQRKSRRLRCLGHVVNLCARALLIGKESKKTLRKLESLTQEESESVWRGRGSVGKLHNIIKYIRWTPQRREQFGGIRIKGELARFDELELIEDNDTRWNSFFLAIGRAINVRERIVEFCYMHQAVGADRRLEDDTLSRCEWDQLERIYTLLEDFYATTMVNEGHRKVFLYDWFPSLHVLLNEIDTQHKSFKRERGYEELAKSCEAAWAKCEKYYVGVDQSPLIYTATMLCPWYKLAWFEQEWTDTSQADWVSNVRGYVEKLWQSDYKPHHTKQAHRSATNTPAAARDSPFARQAEAKRLKLTHSPTSVDELTAYLALDPLEEDTVDPIQYWLERRFQFPNLSKLAFDTLAIPPMADDNERSFSSARDLITYRRNRLKEDIIEASECLHSWYGRPEANIVMGGRASTVDSEEADIEADWAEQGV